MFRLAQCSSVVNVKTLIHLFVYVLILYLWSVFQIVPLASELNGNIQTKKILLHLGRHNTPGTGVYISHTLVREHTIIDMFLASILADL